MEIKQEQARTIKMLREAYNMDIDEISEVIGMTNNQVSIILQSDEYENVEVDTKPPARGIKFLLQFAGTMSQISNLLDMKFTPFSDEGMEEFLYQISKRVLQLHNQQKFVPRDYELLKLAMFAKHLAEVHEADPELFERYKRDLNEVGYDRYFGVRLELDTASSLNRKDIEYTSPDPPDFVIQNRSEEVVIECTSSHFSGGDRTAREKYTQFLTSKASKDYFDGNTALFVDVTNIDFSEVHSDNSNQQIEKEKEKDWIRECSENFNLDIGSVLTFRYVGSGRGILHGRRRCDIRDNITQELKDFLDEYYPITDISTETHPYYFSEG